MDQIGDRRRDDLTNSQVPLVRSLILAAGLLVLAFAKYGIGPWPSLRGLAMLAREWSVNLSLPPEAGYVGFSPLQAMLLGSLGLTELGPYTAGSLVLLLVAVGLPVLMPAVRAHASTQGLVAIALAGGAVLPTLTFWVGGYDTPFVIAATVSALARRYWVSLMGWAVLAFQHHQMALVSLAVWALLRIVDERTQGRRIPVVQILGAGLAAAAGTGLIYRLAGQWGLSQSRLEYLDGIGGVAAVAPLYWPLAWLITFSSLGVVWFLVIDSRLRSDAVTRAFAASSLLVAVVLPQLVLDQVRVPALALLVPTLTWVRMLQHRVAADVRAQLVRQYGAIAVVLPVVLVWEGRAYFPGWTILTGAG